MEKYKKKKRKKTLASRIIHSDSYSKTRSSHMKETPRTTQSPHAHPLTKCKKGSRALAITTANGKHATQCQAHVDTPPHLQSSKPTTSEQKKKKVQTNTAVQCPLHKLYSLAPNMHILQRQATTSTQDQWRAPMSKQGGHRRKEGYTKKKKKRTIVQPQQCPRNAPRRNMNTAELPWEPPQYIAQRTR